MMKRRLPAAMLLGCLGIVAAICAIAHVSTSGYGGEGLVLLDPGGDKGGQGRRGGVSPAAANLARLAAAARQTDDMVLPPRHRRPMKKEVHQSVELDPLAVLSAEAARAEREEEAARKSADEAHSRVAGMSKASVRERALEGDALRRATGQNRSARRSAQSAMSDIAASQPAASEAARRNAMEMRIIALKAKAARFKKMAMADEDRARAYVESAQSSVRGLTLAQERSEIMADAPFDRSAERVDDILKQLEDTQARLKERTESAAARAGRLQEEAKKLVEVGGEMSEDDAKAAKEALARAEGEAAEAQKRAALAKRSAGVMALEHSAMRKALGDVKKARGRYEGAEGALQLAEEEAAKRRKEAEARSRKEEAESAAKGLKKEAAEAKVGGGAGSKAGAAVVATGKKVEEVRKERNGGKTMNGKGVEGTGLAWPQKMTWPKQRAPADAGGALDAKEEERVYRRAYGDAFHEAFSAVFGPKGVLGYEASAVIKAGGGTPNQSAAPTGAAAGAVPAPAKIAEAGGALEGVAEGGEGVTALSQLGRGVESMEGGKRRGVVLRDGGGELGAQFKDRDVAIRKGVGADGERERRRRMRGTAVERRDEGRRFLKEGEREAIARGGARVEGRAHGRVWRFRNPKVDEGYDDRGRGRGGGYVLVPEREWNMVKGEGSVVRVAGERRRIGGGGGGEGGSGFREGYSERRGPRELGDFEV